MTKSQSDYQVGDTKSTPLRTEEFGMAGWLELAERVNAETAQKACRPSVIQSQAYLTRSSIWQDGLFSVWLDILRKTARHPEQFPDLILASNMDSSNEIQL